MQHLLRKCSMVLTIYIHTVARLIFLEDEQRHGNGEHDDEFMESVEDEAREGLVVVDAMRGFQTGVEQG